jgi:protein CpxP
MAQRKNAVEGARVAARGHKGLRPVLLALMASACLGLSAQVMADPTGALHEGARGHAAQHGPRDVSPEARADRLEYRVKRMLTSVKASDEQKTRISAIVRQAMSDLRPLREKQEATRRAMLGELAKPNLDRKAIESLRTGQLQLTEQASRRTTQALADAAELLSPEQRVALAERMQRFGGRGHHLRG